MIALRYGRMIAILFLLLVTDSNVNALDPNKSVSQYGHTAWRIREGFFGGPVNAIAQTTDGYIWIGTNAGLFRFDGARFVSWNDISRSPLPSNQIYSLLGSSDGSLWIGTSNGLIRRTNQNQFTYLEDGGGIMKLLETARKEIWLTRNRSDNYRGRLCQIVDMDIRCYDEDDGVPQFGATVPLIQDNLGDFWIGGDTALLKWRPGASTIYRPEALKSNTGMGGVYALSAASDGTLWVGIFSKGRGLGLQRMIGGSLRPFIAPGLTGETVEVLTLLEDRDRNMWVGTGDQGIYRIHGDKIDQFRESDGLSGNFVLKSFEDQEGNLWVATTKGLDLFRDVRVSSFTTREGISSDAVVSVFAPRDGTVWIGNLGNLDQLNPNGKFTRRGKYLQGGQLTSFLEDSDGRIWVGVENTLRVSKGGRDRVVTKRDGGPVGLIKGLAEDSENNVWALNLGPPRTLMRIRDYQVQEEFTEPQVPAASRITADPQNGIWLGLTDGNLARFHNGNTELFQFTHEAGDTRIEQLITGPDGSVMGAAPFGVVAWKNGKHQMLTVHNGLPCNEMYALVFDNYEDLWLYARCGLLRIAKAELEHWWNQPDHRVQLRVFDIADGAQPGAAPFNSGVKSVDGRLWFANFTVMQMIDPARLADNTVVPPVHVEEIIADRKSYSPFEEVKLPPLSRDLRIDYTALSFNAPQKVNFRYKLEGHDTEWQEAGTRRQAFYNDLPPGDYVFRVIASNNDGLWNVEGAILNFNIAAAWYQTNIFRVMCVAVLGVILWGLYRLRIRTISKAMAARFDERLAERTRLAQELHDTYLQTIQGSKLVADDALEHSDDPVHLRRVMHQLSTWLGQAVNEGRAALSSLRDSTTEKNDLAAALKRASETRIVEGSMAHTFVVVGEARDMHPIVRDEIYRIGYEAIRNARAHSGASRVDVELRYGHDLIVRVMDNGIGIDSAVVAGGREGHFGLKGMRERTARIGGKLTLDSRAGSGTEITLIVPGDIAFSTPAHTTDS